MQRRQLLKTLATGAFASVLPIRSRGAPVSARVVVVGGGYAGASCARSLKQLDPHLEVTLVEPRRKYVSCPFSNLVINGERDMASQTFNYKGLAAVGVRHIAMAAKDIDLVNRRVTLSDGNHIGYDKMVMAPGISLDFTALSGYDLSASNVMPHAWQAGPQTHLLRQQLLAMKDGGTVVIVAPANPYRCPPGPYERASLIAAYLKANKPRSKVLILDNKDQFSKQSLFMAAWQQHYGDMVEWQGLSDGARVVRVDPATMQLQTDFDTISADVANVIPPHRAGNIAAIAGLTDRSGWCPVNAASFASTLMQDIHVIGDAAIANAMPKSAFAADAQAKLCAVQVSRSLRGEAPLASKLINTCYSLITPDHGISVAGVYTPQGNRWIEIDGAGGTSDINAAETVQYLEAEYARHWYDTLTRATFG